LILMMIAACGGTKTTRLLYMNCVESCSEIGSGWTVAASEC
jgi:hypothetical protein